MKQRTPIKRTAPPKRVNVKRKRSEFARCYGSRARVAFVKSLACVVCGRVPSENAHIETGGTGRKADYDKIIPLCPEGHRVMHRVGVKTYAEFYEIDLAALAADTERRWQEEAA